MKNAFNAALLFAVLSLCGQAWAQTQSPLVITLFIHDQISLADQAALDVDYLDQLETELEKTTGRDVQFIKVTNKPGYTDFGYRGDDDGAMVERWNQKIIDLLEQGAPRGRLHKYVLVTQNNPNISVQGISHPHKRVAVASLRSYDTLAHEIGHLFGATHDKAETQYRGGWWCLSYMSAGRFALLGSCYEFSQQNRQAIQHYLSGVP